jgi:hypothetical protein
MAYIPSYAREIRCHRVTGPSLHSRGGFHGWWPSRGTCEPYNGDGVFVRKATWAFGRAETSASFATRQ